MDYDTGYRIQDTGYRMIHASKAVGEMRWWEYVRIKEARPRNTMNYQLAFHTEALEGIVRG